MLVTAIGISFLNRERVSLTALVSAPPDRATEDRGMRVAVGPAERVPERAATEATG